MSDDYRNGMNGNGNGNGQDPDQDRVRPIRPIDGGKSKQPIEQVLGDLNEFLGKFGGGGGGSGGPPRQGDGNSPINTQAIGLLVALLFIGLGALTSAYTIDIGEEGVITRLGAYNRTAGPGLHFKMPFGIERVQKVASQKDLQLEFGFRTGERSGKRAVYNSRINESTMLTGDLNVANVSWTVRYRIKDPWKYLFHARNVEQTIVDISNSVMRRAVGDRLVSDVLTTGRGEIAREAKEILQQLLDDRYDVGILVTEIRMQDTSPPDRVKPAFIEVESAKQEQEQLINNAERSYNRVIPEARGKAEKLISDAEAYAVEVVNKSQGDVARFKALLIEYKKAPEITRTRLYIETLEEIFSNTERFTIVDPEIKGLLPVFSSHNGLPPTKPATSE